MSRQLVAPQTVQFITETGCSGECSTVININNGLPLECKEWSNIESALLRERALMDNQLMNSGFVRRIERSSLGNSLRIKKSGIDVGPIRTQDSGAPAVNECKTVFDGITMKEFEKTFYVVNTSKDLQICTKDFIGTKWQDFIGGAISDYKADAFADTDLATIIIAAIIERYQKFVPDFMLLATCGGAGEGLHGDDGILAKAYYAGMGSYFNVISFNLTSLDTFPTGFINAIVGGAKYTTSPADFATEELYLLDFLAWLNSLKAKGVQILNASMDLGTKVLTVASNLITKDVDLKIVLNDGTLVDWSCKDTFGLMLPFTVYQKSMMINDVPLLFDYETIDETNFAQKFKEYRKQFLIYLHNNGFDDISANEIFIGIDPLLLFERQDQTADEILGGNVNVNFMNDIGLQINQFIPLNSLSGTGLFFMTIKGNLLMLDDGSNFMNQISNMGRIAIEKACNENNGMVNIYGSMPPLGSEVEAWGVFASNLIGSDFVVDNKLADREPCEAARLNIVCYDDNVKNHCVTQADCVVTGTVAVTAEYDAGDDETTFTVVITPAGSTGTLAYAYNWSLSDGTGASGTAASFTFVLPGDQKNAGLVFNINGSITSTGAETCTGYFSYSKQFGTGGVFTCAATGTNDNAVNSLTTALSLSFDIDGVTEAVAFTDALLNYNTTGDYPEIKAEIEAILPGTTVTISKTGTVVTLAIEDLPSFVSEVFVVSATTTNDTAALTINC